MNKGVVQQIATPQELYRSPANTFVAGFIGSPAMNFLRGRIDRGALTVGGQSIPVSGHRPGDVIVGVRPEDFVTANGDGFDADVAFVENLGPEALVHFTARGLQPAEVAVGGLMVARVGAEAGLEIAARPTVKLKLNRFALFDASSGAALG